MLWGVARGSFAEYAILFLYLLTSPLLVQTSPLLVLTSTLLVDLPKVGTAERRGKLGERGGGGQREFFLHFPEIEEVATHI